jgi:osomolarity two-component system sensor histidine kinase NIK1
MCSSLTDQVRSIATVTTAVARGDLTRKIEIQVEGEMATLKTTVNSMVDQLSAFASEVTRVALEVGTQGILGGQARVEGVQGTWADLTLNVNVSTSARTWPFDVPLSAENGKQSDRSGTLDLGGDQGCRARRFVQASRSRRARRNARPQDDGQLNGEPAVYPRERGHARVTGSRNRGHFGRTGLRSGRAGHVEGASFISPDSGVTLRMCVRTLQVLADNVNLMAMNLTNQVRSIAEVTKAVAGGDLTKKVEVDVRGEMLDLKETVNGMTESLSVFADEVTRVAREVGTEGRLGGQANVTNVGGTWKVRSSCTPATYPLGLT